MQFDKFADWVTEQNIFLVGVILLAGIIIAGIILKTAWGTWDKRN